MELRRTFTPASFLVVVFRSFVSTDVVVMEMLCSSETGAIVDDIKKRADRQGKQRSKLLPFQILALPFVFVACLGLLLALPCQGI